MNKSTRKALLLVFLAAIAATAAFYTAHLSVPEQWPQQPVNLSKLLLLTAATFFVLLNGAMLLFLGNIKLMWCAGLYVILVWFASIVTALGLTPDYMPFLVMLVSGVLILLGAELKPQIMLEGADD